MIEYYAQRASAGLIIAEGTQYLSARSGLCADTGNLYRCAHRRMATHYPGDSCERRSRVSATLARRPHFSPVVAARRRAPRGAVRDRPQTRAFTESGFQPCVTPRALEALEIPEIVQEYHRAASNALEAGFDGVEIHAANGYLIEQFLRDSTNKRTDAYGGSREKRARFALEVVEAVVRACGSQRVGIRLSPVSPANDSALDSDSLGTYSYLIQQLNRFGLAYVHVIEGVTQGLRECPDGFHLQVLRREFTGLYIANNGYDLKLAQEARRHNLADLIAFGRLYIANADLVERLCACAPLNVPDPATFFGGGAHGYTDYPTMAQSRPGGSAATPQEQKNAV